MLNATNERLCIVFRARLLFWLEVRFPAGAERGLRALVCCRISLDREEGHNWDLFSQEGE